MDHLSANTSPLRSKFKNEPSKSVTKQSKSVDDNPTAQTKIPKKSQLPTAHVQFRTSQIRVPEHIRTESAAPQGPKRSRSTPASSIATYAYALASKQAFQQATSKSSDTSPTMLHRQSAIPVPVPHITATVSAVKKPSMLHPSVSVPGTAQQLDSQRQRLVDRAIKARLYLLRQSGPNRFLIGGDSPDSRFHVTIGPQSCSCNKTHCVHLLFVMLRVLKVNRNDPMLWMRQLRNYEAESLLQEFQTRLSNRTTLKRSSKKFTNRNSRIEEKTAAEEDEQKLPQTQSLPPSMIGGHVKLSMTKSDSGEGSEGGDGVMATVMEEEGEGEESDKSDNEEAICPICLNELDEGEDLLVCSSCHNHLHQHCMDIWAGEQRRKKEDVRCPVCRAHWPYTVSLGPSSTSPSLTAIHMSIPVGRGVGNEGTTPGAQAAAASGGGGAIGKGGSPSHFVLSGQKMQLLERMKAIFGSSVEGLFSSDWKAREAAVMHISRESIPLLLPHLQPSLSKVAPMNEGATGSGGNSSDPREVQEVSMEVVMIAANDSVLKVFLAALELMRIVLGYSVCKTEEEASFLQSLLGPILPVLLTRCADAQRRVKNCSIETACNLCLGQDGPLGVGSACGSPSKLVSDVKFVLQSAIANQFDANHSHHWWLGRLAFIDRMLSHFSWDFLLPQCQLNPQAQQPFGGSDNDSDEKGSSNSDSVSGPTSPIDSVASSIISSLMVEGSGSDSQPHSFEFDPPPGMEPELVGVGVELRQTEEASSPSPVPAAVENNLLMQVWYFAAKATHVPHRKLGKVAQKVIIKIAKGLQDDPGSLEIVHDVVSKVHRTQAEGLLDRVLRAREKPLDSLMPDERRSADFASATLRPRRREDDDELSPRSREKERRRRSSSSPDRQHAARQKMTSALKVAAKKNRASTDLSQINIEGSLKFFGVSSASRKKRATSPETRCLHKTDTESTLHAGSPEFEASDESFQSAISDLDHRQRLFEEEEEKEEGSEETSSASNSHDSKKDGNPLSRSSSGYASVASGASGASAAGGMERRPGTGGLLGSKLYKRQSTVDSAVSTDEDYSSFGYACKKNIEEEEAAAEAKVRSMLPQDMPHPSLSGMPLPSLEHKVLIHIQRNKLDGNSRESTDGSEHPPYLEGEHWVKGKIIGTGAFCSCFLARDIKNGTMFAVKQVSYVRNTQKEQQEELNRLTQEVTMLGRLNHPNVVRCLGATQHDGHINVFVEWMAGGCLDQLLHDFGRFSENVACDYTRQITYGIVYLHENSIIHRDLKGGNILVDSTGRRLRIADFGAAARLATNTTGFGEFQEMEGTVAFMAPEVVRGGQVDETGANLGYGRKCDVWSIGCVIIQMLTAKPPWAGTYEKKNKFQLIFMIGQATEAPPMPEFANPSLKDFTIRCLEVRPEDRPTSSELLKHPLFTASA